MEQQQVNVGVVRHSVLVETFGVNPVEVMFCYWPDTGMYTAEVANTGEYLLMRKPEPRRVQFEDGEWHEIPEGYWVCERVLKGPPIRNQGVCAVMPTPQQAFVEGFNQNY